MEDQDRPQSAADPPSSSEMEELMKWRRVLEEQLWSEELKFFVTVPHPAPPAWHVCRRLLVVALPGADHVKPGRAGDGGDDGTQSRHFLYSTRGTVD